MCLFLCCLHSSTGFQDAEMIPAMIVLMGNFSASATSNAVDADYVGLKEGFAQLARLIDTYSSIKVSSWACAAPNFVVAEGLDGALCTESTKRSLSWHCLHSLAPSAASRRFLGLWCSQLCCGLAHVCSSL
jgi:hypothetical protein